MVGGDDHGVGPADPGRSQGDGLELQPGVFPVPFRHRDVRVVVLHPGALPLEEADDLQGRRFPLVVDVFLVGDAQDQDPRAAKGSALGGQNLERLVDDALGYLGVDLAGQLDELRLGVHIPSLPGQVEWIDWDAVTAEARARQSGVNPPTTLGIFSTEKTGSPGFSRSGKKDRKKSLPPLQTTPL